MAWIVVAAALGCACAGLPGSADATAEAGDVDRADLAEEAGSEAEAPPEPDLSPEEKYPGEPGAAATFLPERQAFWDQPFPCDTRRRADGRIRLDDFPNPFGVALLDDYVAVAEKRLDGFSPNGAIYFHFDEPLDPETLPSAAGTLESGSPIVLVNVSPDSPHRGERVPVESWYWDRPAPVDGYYVVPYLLVARPLGGFPMRPGDRYACLITRKLKDAQGRHLGQTGLVFKALSGETSAPLYGMFSPLRTWLAEAAGIGPDDVAVATVFTVADPVGELAAAAAWIKANSDPGSKVDLSGPVESKPTSKNYRYFVGRYQAPNFQTGEPPYKTKGAILFDSLGAPVVQWIEEITFALTVPKGPSPPQGWPLVFVAHGTGGSYKTFTYNEAEKLAAAGLAAIGIDQPLHGERYHGPLVDTEFYSFNFTNPEGARSLFRQSALDSVSLAKLARNLTFTVSGEKIKFDASRFGFFGHSQGGLTGALYLAVEGGGDKGVQAGVLSGAGGGLAYTILLRKKLDSGTTFDISKALKEVLKLAWEDELDLYHPVLTLAQMLVDVSDPINYSPFYYRAAAELGLPPAPPVDVFVTEGVKDPYTPAVTAENLAIAGGIPPLFPVVHDHPGFALRNLGPLSLPVKSNISTPDGSTATAALAQYASGGHFVAYDDPDCRKLWIGFLSSALAGGDAILPKP